MRFLLIREYEVLSMKRKLYTLAFILIFTLSACNTEKPPITQTESDTQPRLYEILDMDGTYYLQYSEYALEQFHKQLDEISKHSLLQRKIEYPQFSSVEDMQQAIKNQKLSFVQLLSIYCNTGKASPLKIIDPDRICEIVYPENLQFDEIRWYGDLYVFDLSNSSTTANLFIPTDTRYEEVFNDHYINFSNILAICGDQIISEGEIPDREAYELVYTENAGGEEVRTHKRIRYQLQGGTKTVYVFEDYRLKDHLTNDFISATIPYQTTIFVEDGANKFYAKIEDYESRPTTDWLLSFGFKLEGTPDYADFFQKSLTMDGGPAESYAIETKKLFDNYPTAFITALNQENEDIQNRVLPYLIVETRTHDLDTLTDHFAAYKDDPQYTGLLSIFDTHLNQRLTYEASRKSE